MLGFERAIWISRRPRCSLRSVAVLSSRAQERPSLEIRAKRAKTSKKSKNRLPGFVAVFEVASAPISSRFLYPRPPLLLSVPSQNRHATQASLDVSVGGLDIPLFLNSNI